MLKNKQSFYVTLEDLTVAELFLHYLKTLENVDVVFGVPGKGVEWFLTAMDYSQAGDEPEDRNDITFMICRHDGSATFMADGYARVSGKLGVALVTSGPGATNAVTGVMCAQVDSSSTLLISGEVSEDDFGRGAFQEGADSGIDIKGMFANVSEYSEIVTNSTNFQTILMQALRTASAGPKKAVHVAVPTSVAAFKYDSVQVPARRRNYTPATPVSDPEMTRIAFKALRKAKRPLIFVGSGARESFLNPKNRPEGLKRLERFTKVLVEKWGIPVMTTPRAKGVFPESHPMSLRNYGMAACAWPQYYMKQDCFFPGQPSYDGLLVLGSQLKQWSTNAWDEMLVPDGPLIQVDLDPKIIARGFPVDLGIVGDCEGFLDQLTRMFHEATPTADEQAEIAARKTLVTETLKQYPAWTEPEKRTSDAVPVLPQRVMADLQEVLDSDAVKARGAHVVIDTGNTMGWTWSELVIDQPVQIWYNTGMGSMGWGSGAGIGAKVADPKRDVIIITGDGGFFMNGKEISTAYAHNLGVVWVVFEDNNLLMVSQGMMHDYTPPPGYDTWYDFFELGNADLVKFSASLGADAYGTTKPGDVAKMLPKLLDDAREKNKPQVLVVRIDPNEAPPYPAPPPADGLPSDC